MHLTRREKRLSVAAAAGVALLVLYFQWLSPTLTRMETLERVIPEKRAALEEMKAKAAEYELIHHSLTDVEKQVNSVGEAGLLSDVEAVLRKNQLTGAGRLTQRIVPVDSRWKETIVGVELKKVSFAQIVKFLEDVKTIKTGVRVDSLQIRKSTEGTAGRLDMTAEISSLSGGADVL